MEGISYFLSPESPYFMLTDMWNCAQGVMIFVLFVLKRRVLRLIKKRFVFGGLKRKKSFRCRNQTWILNHIRHQTKVACQKFTFYFEARLNSLFHWIFQIFVTISVHYTSTWSSPTTLNCVIVWNLDGKIHFKMETLLWLRPRIQIQRQQILQWVMCVKNSRCDRASSYSIEGIESY